MSDTVYVLSKAPGTITKQFAVPLALQQLSPLEARRSPLFNTLFQAIWKELQHESTNSPT